MTTARYVGRFAPSPTGPLHVGSLVAAVASWLDARRAGGRWLLRLDDLDRPRNAPGADAAILAELARLGLEWDGPVHRQSADERPYLDAAARLRERGLAFPCGCSRRDLVDGVYPGHCRGGLAAERPQRSLRLRVDEREWVVADAVQGRVAQVLSACVGDFVILRADGVIAYHLATVVDDGASGVTHVVRGADLLDSTPRQMALQDALGLPRPAYAHVPVITGADGQKLSKQNRAPATRGVAAGALWQRALSLLGQSPPPGLAHEPLKIVIDQAIRGWNLAAVPAAASVPLEEAS